MVQPTKITYKITSNELMKEYRKNPALRKRLQTGTYIYADDMLVLNTWQNVEHKSGNLSITDFASQNLENIALPFVEIILKLPGDQGAFAPPKTTNSVSYDPAEENIKIPSDYLAGAKRIAEIINLIKSKPRDTGAWQMMGMIIDYEKSDLNDFYLRTFLGERQYFDAKRSFKNENDVSNIPLKHTIISFAAGYDLPTSIADIILLLAEKSLSLASDDDICYSIVLDVFMGQPMEVKNRWLEKNGVPMLGQKEKEEKN